MSRYEKSKINLDFTEARDSEWQWHQLGICKSAPRSRQTTTPAVQHPTTLFLQAGCPSCHPINSVKARRGITINPPELISGQQNDPETNDRTDTVGCRRARRRRRSRRRRSAAGATQCAAATDHAPVSARQRAGRAPVPPRIPSPPAPFYRRRSLQHTKR